MGQTTAFKEKFIKPGVLIMGRQNRRTKPGTSMVVRKTSVPMDLYSGHDPEDYQHQVGDPVTDLPCIPIPQVIDSCFILNNVGFFPAAKKKKQKT